MSSANIYNFILGSAMNSFSRSSMRRLNRIGLKVAPYAIPFVTLFSAFVSSACVDVAAFLSFSIDHVHFSNCISQSVAARLLTMDSKVTLLNAAFKSKNTPITCPFPLFMFFSMYVTDLCIALSVLFPCL